MHHEYFIILFVFAGFDCFQPIPRPRYAVMRSLVYANVLITGADRADEILYARSYLSSIFPGSFANSVCHTFIQSRSMRRRYVYPNRNYNIYALYMPIDVSPFASHGNNSLRKRERAHEQLIHVRFALIYYGMISHGDAEGGA